MPEHQTYIETHLGGGAVMRNKLPADRNIGIDLDCSVIEQWRKEETGLCELINDDALSFLSSFPFNGDELVYVDPPYLHSTRRRSKIYRHEYTDKDHQELLKVLLSLPCNVMISGYENPLYTELLNNWRCVQFNAKTHTGIREESVWMNYAPPEKLHDSRYLGNNYRERQTVARRRNRLYARIDQMEPIERSELIQWLNSKYGLEAI
ncbi:DNA adenine methylase [Salmonella enterica]|nr:MULTISPECIES: DNA adenine methylase [Salmonella]MCA5714774.1 DNA adenine methylase [Salmonella enterica]MCA5728825.1 DNA adenine methylase [Salmonella enterica]MCA5733862.1 DNA adenine methylase [Salmonella enterica]MCA5736891.1 DNA adenine methylase [Salmonella enterica]MCA5743699.1 DNA adenine methylase [Salmonella enterica]